MRKSFFAVTLVAAILSLSACGNTEKSTTEAETGTSVTAEAEALEGIFYEPISDKEIKKRVDPLASYVYSLLSVDRKVYCSVAERLSVDKNEDELLKLKGEKISDVFSNANVIFADASDMLLEFDSTAEVYQVHGFDPDFRVMVVSRKK